MEKGLQNTKNAIIWLCLAHLFADVYSGFLNPIMPFIAAKLGFSMAVATIIISISHICSSMLQPIFGFFADNILKRFFIFWGVILASLFIPLTPAAPNVFILLIFMILGSLGGSFFHPQAMGFINYFSGKDCSNTMGIFMSMGSLGFAFGPLMATWITQFLGLDVVSYTSLFGLALAFMMFIFVPKLSRIEKQPEHKDFIISFKEILGCRQMNYLMLVAMMKSLITSSSCILLPFLWKSMGYSPIYIGFALFLFVFAGALGSFLSPKAERIFGSKPVVYFSMWATFPMMLIFGLIYKTQPVLSILVFFIIGFTTMLAQPVTMVWAQRTLPKYKSIVAGFINGFCVGTVALCMSVLGAVAQKFGIMNVLIILSTVPAMASYFVKFLKEVK
ncbi:sugar phosphate permease [Acinetobacter sp. CAG:196]|nr:sugar phosphate permease [Acinetobacter sp. CAG:196]